MKISATLTLAILIGSFTYPHSIRAASVTLRPVTGLGRLHGINKGNQAVGYTIGGDEPDGIFYDNGTITKIKVKNGINVQAYGIENNGRAVGKYDEIDPAAKFMANGKTHGFVYFHGNVTDIIDYPGANHTVARGINDPQRVVGHYRDNGGHHHGFFFDKKNYTSLDAPGAGETYAIGVNNPGDIVGYYTDSTADGDGNYHRHGFLYDKQGNWSTIDVKILGVTVTDTFCYGINSSGTIVGAYIDDGGNTHGFVDIAGIFLPVDAPDTPPGVGTFVQGINDNGQLTAFGTTAFLGSVQ
jgi:uncharacterized membrane protein